MIRALGVLGLATCTLLLAADGAAAADDSLFRDQVARVLETRCIHCHSGATPKGNLSLATAAALFKGGTSGPAVVPGRPEESVLIEMISGDRPEMPQKDKPLSTTEIEGIRAWIQRGAPWPADLTLRDRRFDGQRCWALETLTRPAVPAVGDTSWARSPVDRFILAALAAKKLKPSAEADRRTLIRRLYFDLIGLPPEPDEVAAFAADSRPQAYERLVDRLLASPHYGERWGRHWLDVVHYGDTHGYDKDKRRDHAWPYRDYVIRALNHDVAYGRFIREQIAGDVLAGRPGGRDRDRFHRRGTVGFRRSHRAAGRHGRQAEDARSRSRRHGREHDEHVREHDGALRPLP